MTRKFDTLLENILSEMMPASMMDDFGPGDMTKAAVDKVRALSKPSQHYGPLQKLNDNDRSRIVRAIIDAVFTERGNTYTPMADDKDELKDLIKAAIIKVSKDTELSTSTEGGPKFKAESKWAVQFLADRLAHEDLLGKVKYTTEDGKELKKTVTQKEMKAALDAALEDTKGQNAWKKSHKDEVTPEPEESEEEVEDVEEPAASAEEEGEQEAEEQSKKEDPFKGKTETVYFKDGDFQSDDEKLQKAYEKLPDNKDMTWQEVVKLLRTSTAIDLLDAGGIKEEERDVEENGDEFVSALDADEDDSADLSNFDRIINPYYNDTRGSFEKFHGDY